MSKEKEAPDREEGGEELPEPREGEPIEEEDRGERDEETLLPKAREGQAVQEEEE